MFIVFDTVLYFGEFFNSSHYFWLELQIYINIIQVSNIKIQKQKRFCSKKSFLLNYCKSCTEKIHSEIQGNNKCKLYSVLHYFLDPFPWSSILTRKFIDEKSW